MTKEKGANGFVHIQCLFVAMKISKLNSPALLLRTHILLLMMDLPAGGYKIEKYVGRHIIL